MSAESELTKRRGGIDPAALAAACLSAAVSVLAPPGPFGPGSILIGFTILCVVLAYDIDPHRNAFQSFAYAAVCALVVQTALGYPLECLFSSNRDLRLSVLLAELPQCTDQLVEAKLRCEANSHSEVPPIAIIGSWSVSVLLFFFLDRRRPSNKSAKTGRYQWARDAERPRGNRRSPLR